MEENNTNENPGNNAVDPTGKPTPPKSDGNLIAGLILITIGLIFLLARFFPSIDFGDLWPLLLLVAGVLLIRSSIVKSKNQQK